MTASATPPPADPEIKAVFGLLHAVTDDRLGTGPLAELRRMEPTDGVLPPTFWRMLIAHVPDALCQGSGAERAWAVIIHGMALMAPRAHEAKARPGQVLADSGYSEPRFVRLLRAEGPGLAVETRTVCRWLATKGYAMDWAGQGFAPFLLSRLHPRFAHIDTRKTQTDRLARAYFSARAKDSASEETNAS